MNKIRNQEITTTTENVSVSSVSPPIMQLHNFITASGQSAKHFYSTFLRGFFNDRRYLGYEGFGRNRIIENGSDYLLVRINSNGTYLRFGEQAFFFNVLNLIWNSFCNEPIPARVVFRCPAKLISKLSERLEQIAAVRGELYCQREKEEYGEKFAMPDLKLLENYIIGNIISNDSVEVQLDFPEWIQFLLQNDLIFYDPEEIFLAADWNDLKLALPA